jgi:signal transduction histidine kinase
MDGRKQNVLLEKIGAMMEMTDKASNSVQRIASELRPIVLDSLGLCAAIVWVADDFQQRQALRAISHDQERGVGFNTMWVNLVCAGYTAGTILGVLTGAP